MQVQSINNQNNRPSFGQIFVPKRSNFTDAQKKVVSTILNTLRTPEKKFNNQTAEGFYKSKSGIDFNISNYDPSVGSVYLEGIVGAKTTGTGTEEALTWRNSFKIGIYDKEHPFKTDDIKTGIDNKNSSAMPVIVSCGAFILGVMGIVLHGIISGVNSAKETTKPLIEQVDTLAGKAKPIVADTLKVLKPIKK